MIKNIKIKTTVDIDLVNILKANIKQINKYIRFKVNEINLYP